MRERVMTLRGALWALLLPVALIAPDAMYAGFSAPKHWGTTYERLTADAAVALTNASELMLPASSASPCHSGLSFTMAL